MVFKDRQDAAIQLTTALKKLNLANPAVFGIPRGGIIVARIVADALSAPLDIIVCRKLGVPGHEELGFGAIALNNILVLNEKTVQNLGIRPDVIEAVKESEQAELKRRISVYRGNESYNNIAGNDVILIDDGIATGVTMRAAVEFVRYMGPNSITVAAPVCPADSAKEIKMIVDNHILLSEPEYFYAVGQFYQDFPQVSDEEVISALKKQL